MRKEKSAGAVIFREGNKERYYLVLHYTLGHWGFAKGHIEKGEDEITALKREVKEETSLDNIMLFDEFREEINYSYGNVSKTVIFYLAQTKETKIKLSQEHLDFEWLPFKEAQDRITFKSSKNILEKANNYLKNVAKNQS
jgi:bis(5'-nucleosidyl)-tetraphosphatase